MLGALKQKFLYLPVWLWLLLIAIAASGLVWYAMNQPQHGGWRYGACRAFLESTVRFPKTIRIIVAGENQSSASIGFADINAYGAEQVKMFECHYSTGKSGNPVLSKITIDRRILPDDVIARYNAMLPILLTQELDTALPMAVPRSLEDFRK